MKAKRIHWQIWQIVLGKSTKGICFLQNQEDGVDAKLPDIDELIKKLASDEFIEKKINDVLGDDDVELKKE